MRFDHELTSRIVGWFDARPDVMGVAMVGSWARGDHGPDSDLDLMVLTACPRPYLDDPRWSESFGTVLRTRRETWGAVETVRVFYDRFGEVEFNFAGLDWAAIPPDPGTASVVRGGMRVLFDREGALEALVRAVPKE